MEKSGLESFYFEILQAPLELSSAKKISPRLNWPGRLSSNSEGACRISK